MNLIYTNPKLHTPVLFLVFNRLDTTKQVFEAIRQAKSPRLYIAADGHRTDHNGEAEKVQAVRDYVMESIDWNCEVKTLFRKKNLGCRDAVSSAIDWFFEYESEGIILEDDCLADLSFFRYCEELLLLYRDDERIMAISGNYFHGDAYQPKHSYFFSRYPHCWGWATWRRAWEYYDRDMTQWPEMRDSEWLLTVGNGSRDFQRYWNRIFDTAYAKKVDSWAYRWTFSCWSQSGLTILPARNLVRNIGFGENATHTRNSNSRLSKFSLEFLNFPLSHPSNMVRDYKMDEWTDTNYFKIHQLNQLKYKFMTLIGK